MEAPEQNKIIGKEIGYALAYYVKLDEKKSGYVFKEHLTVDHVVLETESLTMDMMNDCIEQLEAMGDYHEVAKANGYNGEGYKGTGLVIASKKDPRLVMSVEFGRRWNKDSDQQAESTGHHDVTLKWFLNDEHKDQFGVKGVQPERPASEEEIDIIGKIRDQTKLGKTESIQPVLNRIRSGRKVLTENEGDETDHEEEGPSEEDITISASGPLGSKVSVGVVGGKFIGEFANEEEAEEAIKAYMKQNNFFPNVWDISDHGNASLHKMSEATVEDADGEKKRITLTPEQEAAFNKFWKTVPELSWNAAIKKWWTATNGGKVEKTESKENGGSMEKLNEGAFNDWDAVDFFGVPKLGEESGTYKPTTTPAATPLVAPVAAKDKEVDKLAANLKATSDKKVVVGGAIAKPATTVDVGVKSGETEVKDGEIKTGSAEDGKGDVVQGKGNSPTQTTTAPATGPGKAADGRGKVMGDAVTTEAEQVTEAKKKAMEGKKKAMGGKMAEWRKKKMQEKMKTRYGK